VSAVIADRGFEDPLMLLATVLTMSGLQHEVNMQMTFHVANTFDALVDTPTWLVPVTV